MCDIISFVSTYYESRNMSGFYDKRNPDIDTMFTKSDIVYKLKSFVYVNNFCILSRPNKEVIDYIHSILSSDKKFCVCVDLNYLQCHHVVVDVDFKHIQTAFADVRVFEVFVVDFIKEFIAALKSIVGSRTKSGAIMMVKLKKMRSMSDEEINSAACNGIHFECPDLVLYRGDNIFLIETIRSKLEVKYQTLIDNTANWNLPFSKKSTGDMYLAVRRYDFTDDTNGGGNTNFTNLTNLNRIKDSVYVNKYSIIRHRRAHVTSFFPLKPFTPHDTHDLYSGKFFGFKSPENSRVIKCTRLFAIDESPSLVKGLIIVDFKSMPHIKYAITRFYNGDCVFELGQSPVDKLLHPFSFDFLNNAIITQFHDYMVEGNSNRSKGIFNLYVFLLCMYDILVAKTYSIFEEIVETNKDNIIFILHFKET